MSVVTCRDLNTIGRAGNQLFLYVFAKAYAARLGATLEVCDWWGRKVFTEAAKDPMISHDFSQTELDSESGKELGYFFGQTEIDLRVFAQHQVYLDFYTRTKARQWLALKPEIEDMIPLRGCHYTAAHMRRGDYVHHPITRTRYCEVSDLSYETAFEKLDLPHPFLRIQEGWIPEDLKMKQMGMPWLQDFLILRGASFLLRGNSSFSVWASWLGNGKTYAPLVGAKSGFQHVQFVEGNWPCTAGQFRNQSDLHLKE